MGRKIQYSAPLRWVATDQDCSAPYVGADFTEYQRAIEAILEANLIQHSAPLRRVAKYSIAPR